MKYAPAQQLFVDFFIEALDFLKYSGPTVEIKFGDFHCVIWPSALKSTSFIFPVTADYPGYRLNVHQEWIDAIISEKYPTLMREQAYYCAYGFYEFYKCNNVIELYPQNSDAIAFAYGLTLLNGVPIKIPHCISEELVLSQLKKFSHKQYTFNETVGSDGHHGRCLSLSVEENKRLFSQLLDYDKDSKCRSLDIRFGTKERPFENIDEAIKYIEFLEKDAVEHDLFLNSPFNKSPYRYDIGAIKSKGRDIIGGIFKIPWASAFTAHAENSFPKNSFVITQLNPSNNDWEWLRENNHEINYIPLFALKPNLSRRRFLFRGQYEEFVDDKTNLPTCKPNLYRHDVENNPLPHRIKAYEMSCLVTRHPLVQQLGVKGIKIFNEPFRLQLNRLGLAQQL